MFAGIYHWYPKMFGRFMNETLGKFHFWGTLIGAYAIFWPMHYIGMAGVPRRYYSFQSYDAFKHFGDMNKFNYRCYCSFLRTDCVRDKLLL